MQFVEMAYNCGNEWPSVISYSVSTLVYSDKDQVGDFTMLPGDTVTFHLATDKRSGTQRATNVRLGRLVEEQRNKPQRETVSTLNQ